MTITATVPATYRAETLIGCGIAALVLVRLIAAGFTPLAIDEAYYWLWSKNLAGGYYDHPPMIAVLIRLGTLIAGDNEFGRAFHLRAARPACDLGGLACGCDPAA